MLNQQKTLGLEAVKDGKGVKEEGDR